MHSRRGDKTPRSWRTVAFQMQSTGGGRRQEMEAGACHRTAWTLIFTLFRNNLLSTYYGSGTISEVYQWWIDNSQPLGVYSLVREQIPEDTGFLPLKRLYFCLLLAASTATLGLIHSPTTLPPERSCQRQTPSSHSCFQLSRAFYGFCREVGPETHPVQLSPISLHSYWLPLSLETFTHVIPLPGNNPPPPQLSHPNANLSFSREAVTDSSIPLYRPSLSCIHFFLNKWSCTWLHRNTFVCLLSVHLARLKVLGRQWGHGLLPSASLLPKYHAPKILLTGFTEM